MAQSIELEDFSGGVTDYYLNAPLNKMKSCDNLLINQYPGIGKPFTRPGSGLYDIDYPQIPAGAQRISTAFHYKDILHIQSSDILYYYSETAIGGEKWVEVKGPLPTQNKAFIGASTASFFTYDHWNYHTLVTHSGYQYPKKIIINAAGKPEVFEAGLPAINSTTITFAPSTGPNNYLYKFVYKQQYTVLGNVIFEDLGTTSSIKTVTSTLPITISNIPVLSNGTDSNFRTNDIKVEIYRTENNQQVFYRVGEVTNGATTFVDNVPDASLVNNLALYTTGGIVDNDRPPKCKLVHVMGDVAYYANVKDETNQELNFRIYHSIPGDIDSVPSTFYSDVDDEIISVSSTKSNAIVLCRNSIYRIDGLFDEFGLGGMLLERISDTSGCVSPQGVVQALDGVFWLGQDGAYFTDGFKVSKLNGDYDKTYKTFVLNGQEEILDEKTFKIQGKYDKKKNRIWWAIQKGEAFENEVNACYVLDLNWGIRDNATFTTVSGESFAPTAIEFVNGEMIRCDKRGYIFKHQDTLYSDPKIDTFVSPSLWARESIIYDLETIAINFGTSATRKYVTQVNVTCESSTNLSLLIVSNNDDSRKVADLLPIRYRGNILWGASSNPDVYWGDHQLEWNRQGLISEKRRMPAKNLRCNFKSVKLTNAKVAIINSELLGKASVNSFLKKVTLTEKTTYEWPTNSVGYYIAFENDNYTREYLITGRSQSDLLEYDELTYSDPDNLLPDSTNLKWVLRGYPKDEVLNLLNMSIVYDVAGPTLNTYKVADSGEVST
jgi:hypothetical protein